MFRPRKIPRKNRQKRKAPRTRATKKAGRTIATITTQFSGKPEIRLSNLRDIQKIIEIREKDLIEKHPDWNIQRVREQIARELGIPPERIAIKKSN